MLNVFYSVSNLYFKQLFISIDSLLKFNKNVSINVIYSELNHVKVKLLEDFVKSRNSSVNFYCIDARNLGIGDQNNRYGSETYYKFLIPRLTDAEIVLYLDVDTMITGKLDELKTIKLDNFYLAARPYKNFQTILEAKKRLRIRSENDYFNAGVMLLNLKKIRSDEFFNFVLNQYHQHKNKLIFADQDLLNIILEGQFVKLPLEYNYSHLYFKFKSNFKIIHFSEKFKPNTCFKLVPYKKEYMLSLKHYRSIFDENKFCLCDLDISFFTFKFKSLITKLKIVFKRLLF